MGSRRKNPDFAFSEKYIQQCLYRGFLSPSSKKYEMFNLFVFEWESDYLAITKSDYVYEIEIKISRADYFNDFKHKGQKHLILEEKCASSNAPNYFYYAVPEELITIEEVPEYAGLIYVNSWGGIRIVKQAPKIIKESLNLDNLNLTNKFYYSYINWRDKYERSNIEDLKKTIKELEKDLMSLDKLLSEANSEIDRLKYEIRQRDIKTSEGTLPL